MTAFTSGVPGLYTLGLIESYGVTNEVMAAGGFWFYWIVATVVTLFPVIILYVLSVELKPTLLDELEQTQTREITDKLSSGRHSTEHRVCVASPLLVLAIIVYRSRPIPWNVLQHWCPISFFAHPRV